MSPGAASLPHVRIHEDLTAANGAVAVVHGRYEAIPRPVRGATRPRPHDRAVVILADDSSVFIEPLDDPRSVRPTVELERLDQQLVEVRGIVHMIMPSSGQGLMAPCVRDATVTGPVIEPQGWAP